MFKNVRISSKFAILLVAATAATWADSINFENQCPSGQQTSGPCSTLFSTVGDEENLTVSTSSGFVSIQGGALFDNTAYLPSDETALYGSAGNASVIGVYPGSGFANPLTIIFPEALTSFSLDVFNGNTMNVEYQLTDNLGKLADFMIAPNFSSGLQSIGFATIGTTVTVSAMTGQSGPSGMTWDFLVDNINFTTQTAPAPEPASALLIGVALVALGLARRPRKGAVWFALLAGTAWASTAPPVVTLTCPAGNGVVGAAYSSSLSASGGVSPYTFSIVNGALPAGLMLNATTGAITGTPMNGGPATFTSKAVDSLIPGAGGSPNSTSTVCTIAIVGPSAITDLNPSTAVAGGSMFTLTIIGTGFTPTSVGMWNGTPLPTTFIDNSHLTVPIAAGLIPLPQYATVTVTNSGLTSNDATFSVLETWVQITDQYAVTFGQATPQDTNLIFDWQSGIAFANFQGLLRSRTGHKKRWPILRGSWRGFGGREEGQVFGHHAEDELGPAADVKLAVNPLYVCVHAMGRDSQAVRDGFLLLILENPLNNL